MKYASSKFLLRTDSRRDIKLLILKVIKSPKNRPIKIPTKLTNKP